MGAHLLRTSCAAAIILFSFAGCMQRIVQPLRFNHNKHIENGVECGDCHQHFRDEEYSGLPATEVCMDCHEDDESQDPNIKILLDYAERGENVPWQRVYDVAPHVFYSHRRHVRVAGLTCGGCHGDIASLTAPPERPLVNQTMNWCLGCHVERGATTDCIHCHR
ncbi:MAG: hypothetical protein D6760_05870 [Deltaproteobacteria bacterium]|nr:MAG: hypothetical protein D6760_05870 [Deltaproteobacteria bacterium]